MAGTFNHHLIHHHGYMGVGQPRMVGFLEAARITAEVRKAIMRRQNKASEAVRCSFQDVFLFRVPLIGTHPVNRAILDHTRLLV